MKQNGILENQKTLLEQAMEAEITEEMDAKEKAHIEKLKKTCYTLRTVIFAGLLCNIITQNNHIFRRNFIEKTPRRDRGNLPR